MAALEQSSLMSSFSEGERDRPTQGERAGARERERKRERDAAIGGEEIVRARQQAGRLCVSRRSIGKHGDEQEMLKRTERTITGSHRWMLFHQARQPEGNPRRG